jgi:hypothetical protein
MSPLVIASIWFDLCSTRIRKALLEKKEMTESGFICFMMVHYFLWTYPKRYKTHSLISYFRIYCITKFGCVWVSSGDPKNRIQLFGWIWMTRVTQITEFSYLGDPKNQIRLFRWIRVSLGDPNLEIIAKNWIWQAVYQWRMKSGLMGNFLSPIFGIPEFLPSVPVSTMF